MISRTSWIGSSSKEVLLALVHENDCHVASFEQSKNQLRSKP